MTCNEWQEIADDLHYAATRLGRFGEWGMSTRARVYTEQEVNSEAFDQPVSRVGAKIIICSTPRTGSYLLCRAMIHAGIGIPHEYFNRMNAGIIGSRYR